MNTMTSTNLANPSSLHLFTLFGKSIDRPTFISAINRFSMFIVFFWFGWLKVISVSPAEQLIDHLHSATIASLITKEHFVILLGVFECLIGILWLIPSLTKIAFWCFAIQIFTTFLPFVYLGEEIVHKGFQLSLTGQYIVKNVVLISCAMNILCQFNCERSK